jgi:hypothetical protein
MGTRTAANCLSLWSFRASIREFEIKVVCWGAGDWLLEMPGEVNALSFCADELVDRRVGQTKFGACAGLVAGAERDDPVESAGEGGGIESA